MAREIDVKLNQREKEVNIAIERFDKGVYTLIDESNMPPSAAVEAKNLMQKEDGRWAPRWGSDWYGADLGGTIQGVFTFRTDAGDVELVAIAGDTAYRSQDDGATWDALSGQTFTTGKRARAQQIKSFLYITNGTDAIARYDGTTTLQTYTTVNAPTGLTATESSLTGTAFTYYYAVSAVNDVGFSEASTEASEQVNLARDDWDGTNDKITLSWSASTGAKRYDIYIGDASGELTYLTSTSDTSFVDDGSIAPNPFLEAPSDNTTTGPKVKDIALSGNRMWATDDQDNTWRVWWTGSGQYLAFFSSFYGGGWVDLEKGGQERPVKVVHYQDGKGNAFATVMTSDPAGKGSVWQIDLQTLTVGDTSFTVPVPVKIVGSVGAISPGSVVFEGNNTFFFNRKGFFTLGPKPQILNLLSTEELSVNIRPSVETLEGDSLSGVESIVQDGKVFASVPYNSTTNNRIFVFDLERRNWNDYAFDFGVDGWLEYVDTNGDIHLLAWEPSGTRLIEIGENIQGDKDQSFDTSYVSPLMHVTKDRVDFAKIFEVYFELGRPQGKIVFEILGNKRNENLAQLSTNIIEATAKSGTGWSTVSWSTQKWSDTSDLPTALRSSTIKKVVYLRERVNTIQFRLTSSSKNQNYVTQLFRARGIVIPSKEPSNWRI